MKNNDKTKQVNFTIAIYICREGRMKKLSFFHTPFFIIHSVFSIIQYTYYRFRTSSDPSLHTSRCVLYCHSDLHTQHSYRCIPPE